MAEATGATDQDRTSSPRGRYLPMTESPSLVPADELTAQLPNIGEKYFIPEALALCCSLQGRRAADLSEDEILMLALTAAQAALAKHVTPGNRDAEKTLSTILGVLDHDTVVQAEIRKLHGMQIKRLFSSTDNRRTMFGLLRRVFQTRVGRGFSNIP
jgi:hypothetical protein